MIRTVAACDDDRTIAKVRVGRYDVELRRYVNLDGSQDDVYRIRLGNQKVLCMTRSDDATYPKLAAMVGNAMVEAVKADRARSGAR